MYILQKIVLVFTILGALNWGLIGFFDFNLVETLFKDMTMVHRVIYSIIGICALINIGIFFVDFDES